MFSAMSQSFLGNEKLKSWADRIQLMTIIDRVIENKDNVINLDKCNISILPDEFFLLSCRESIGINLSHNKISDLSPEWSALRVQSLALDHNKLTTIPSVLKFCERLTWLNLGHNPLKTISPDVGDLIHLESLLLNDTQIDTLPKEIAKLTALDTFGARKNNLKSFPSELCYLENLSWLTLVSNNIKELPEEFCNLKSLVHLNLAHNYLKEVPLVLTELQELKFCYLSYNLIQTVMEELLMKMTHVKCLHLVGNNITNITKENLMVYKFVVVDACERENHQNSEDADSDSDDWETSIASSELYVDISDDESDDQINIDLGGQIYNKISKFSTAF